MHRLSGARQRAGLRTSPAADRLLDGCRRVVAVALGGLLLVGLGSGCGGSSTVEEAETPVEMVKAGSWYAVLPWPHDGQPHESSNFVVFSDAASQRARREAAVVAERVWAQLADEFEMKPEMLHFPAGQDKIHLYVYKDHYPQAWGGRAYHGGVVMWSLDHEQRPDSAGNYAAVMKHELVHVFQDLLFGGFDPPVDVWFYEGMAEAVVGGTSGGAITGLDHLADLTAEYGAISPASLKHYSQIPSSDAGFHFHYPLFQLAVEYLTDVDGHGRSLVDARDVIIDVAGGVPFAEAFEARMGIGLRDYEDEFFGRMDTYLPRYRSVVFTPVGIAVLTAVVVLIVIGTPAMGARRWRLAAVNAEKTAPGRVARIGFYSGMAIASFIVVALCLLGLTAVGTEDELYNTWVTPKRTQAYWILGGYLLASAGLLSLAVHRWIQRSRSALLVAPLVIVVSGITIFILLALF